MVTTRHGLDANIVPILRSRGRQSSKTKDDLGFNYLSTENTNVVNNNDLSKQESFLEDGSVSCGKVSVTKCQLPSDNLSSTSKSHPINASDSLQASYLLLKYFQAICVIVLLILLALAIFSYASHLMLSVTVTFGQFCLGWLVTYFNKANRKFTFQEQRSSEVKVGGAYPGWLMSYGIVCLYSLTVFVYMQFL